LDEAAVSAVEGWRFVPAKRGDTPVASTVMVPINFKLDN
jgi:protein TonB